MTDSTDRREETLEAKYGGKEGLAAKRREWQLKSRANPNTKKGGFKWLKENDPAKLKELSREGVKKRLNRQNPTEG
jgi:hypothetical protein